MAFFADEIQPGWRVFDSTGEELGTVISVDCDYLNTTPFPLSFGESADTNEMCIFSGRYYPSDTGETIECF